MRLQKLIDRPPKEQILQMVSDIGFLESQGSLYTNHGGRYQLLDSFVSQFNKDHNTNYTSKDMEDPLLSTMVMIDYISNNVKEGDDIMDVYMKHHFGQTGGNKLLNARPDEPLSNILSQQAINRNPYITDNNLNTAQDLLNFWNEEKDVRINRIKEPAKTQYMLRELGYYNGGIDALPGNKTNKALQQFQEHTGLDEQQVKQFAQDYYNTPYRDKIMLSKNGYLREVNDVNLATTDKVISDVYNIYENSDYNFNKASSQVDTLRDYYYRGTDKNTDRSKLNGGVDSPYSRYTIEDRIGVFGPQQTERQGQRQPPLPTITTE